MGGWTAAVWVALASVACLVGQGCCPLAPAPAPPPTVVHVRVSAALLATHATDLPVNLFGRVTPGTLLHRGVLLATICEPTHDVATDWELGTQGDADVVVWIAHTYPNSPITPCGFTSGDERRSMIADRPEGRPLARARVPMGGAATLVLADP